MQEVFRLFSRWVIARSLGAGILYFLMQVGWLSWYAYCQCPADDKSGVQDCIWYVYKQVPSALPLAAVFAAGVMVIAEMLERFVDAFPSTDQSSKWGFGTGSGQSCWRPLWLWSSLGLPPFRTSFHCRSLCSSWSLSTVRPHSHGYPGSDSHGYPGSGGWFEAAKAVREGRGSSTTVAELWGGVSGGGQQ